MTRIPRIWGWLMGEQGKPDLPDGGVEKPDPCLIVGLGNPGAKYRGNRHNIGFMAVDRLAQELGISLGRVHHRALFAKGEFFRTPVMLAKPQTFMNSSGESVNALATYYRIHPSRVLVVYDEIDLPLGSLRLRQRGGSGGHNGMKSVIQHLGNDFPRLRLGVGRPPGRMEPAAYVLHDFTKEELPIVEVLLDDASAAIMTFIQNGVDLAMTQHNKK